MPASTAPASTGAPPRASHPALDYTGIACRSGEHMRCPVEWRDFELPGARTACACPCHKAAPVSNQEVAQ